MFTLIREDEAVPFNKSLVCVLFGEPGMGKTSLSFTSRSPLLMDFDDGVRRSVGRKTAIKFDSWNDVLEFMDSDVILKEGVKTLITDTAGTMLDDYLARHIIGLDPKYGNGAGGLGLKGYGIMKDSFSNFLAKGSKMGIESFIFICHTSEKDDGDSTRLKPKVTGGSYDVLISKADLVGYLEMKNGVATLDFNPTTRHIGKNCAEFKAMPVPSYAAPEYVTFMTRVLDATRDRMTKMSEAQVAAVNQVNALKDTIAGCTKLEELEALVPSLQALSPAYKLQVASMHDQRYVEIWAPGFLDPEKVKTPEDFEALSAVVRDLPQGVQVALRAPVAELAKAQGVTYDKEAKKFVAAPGVPKSETTVPQTQQTVPNSGQSVPAKGKTKTAAKTAEGAQLTITK